LGDAYFSIGIYEKAIYSYENAIKINNVMDEAYYNLSVCLFLQEKFYEAKFNVEEAVKLNSENI
jgi:tetratricopeptide (TPR) repeat protein